MMFCPNSPHTTKLNDRVLKLLKHWARNFVTVTEIWQTEGPRNTSHVCVCVCVCSGLLYSFIHVHTSVCEFVWTPEDDIKFLLQWLSTLFFGQGLSLSMEFINWQDWFIDKLHGSSYQVFPNNQNTDVHYCVWLLPGGRWCKLRLSSWQSMLRTEPSSQYHRDI